MGTLQKLTLMICMLLWVPSVQADTFNILEDSEKANGSRIAVVVGNKTYDSLSDLNNPLNDADDVSEILVDLGYRVYLGKDLTAGELIDIIYESLRDVRQIRTKAKPEYVFFYAGHGMEMFGANFILPRDLTIDFSLERNERFERLNAQAVNLAELTEAITSAGAQVSVVILDACRNDPFSGQRTAEFTRSAGAYRGFAELDKIVQSGMFIMYGAGRGQTALDGLPTDVEGERHNGIFTRVLKQHLAAPNKHVIDVIKATQSGVKELTNGQQNPGYYDQTDGYYYLNPLAQTDTTPEKRFVAFTPEQSASAISKVPVTIFYRSSRLTDAQNLADRIKENGGRPNIVNTDLEGITEQEPGTFRLVRLVDLDPDAQKAFNELKTIVTAYAEEQGVPSKLLPHPTQLYTLASSPFQVQLH